jgi:hypothetical protein
MYIKRLYRLRVSVAPVKSRQSLRSMQMLDIIMVALGLAFFAVSVGYAIACDRL